MITVNDTHLTIIRRGESPYAEIREIIADTIENCPSTIGIKPANESVNIEGVLVCDYKCKECWKKSLDNVEDFRITWKYKGSDEYV